MKGPPKEEDKLKPRMNKFPKRMHQKPVHSAQPKEENKPAQKPLNLMLFYPEKMIPQ